MPPCRKSDTEAGAEGIIMRNVRLKRASAEEAAISSIAGTYDCVLVHVRVRIRVHLCDRGERERIAPAALVTDAMYPRDPSLS